MPKLQARKYYEQIKNEQGLIIRGEPRFTYTLTIPQEVMDKKKWEKGDEISIIIDDSGDVILRKAY